MEISDNITKKKNETNDITRTFQKMPIISIIIPVYKVEPYLSECLNSVVTQTFSDYECILVDDGSPDNCSVICDEYAAQYSQIIVIHKENGGLSDARNAGILAACGEYIVLLDSDDLFASDDALEKFYEVIRYTKPSVICNVNVTIFDSSGMSTHDEFNTDFCYVPFRFYKENLKHKRSIFGGCFFSLRRDFLLGNNLFFKKGIFHEDMHWIPRMLICTNVIVLNHNLFYKYRMNRDGSITSKMNPKRLTDQLIIIQDLLLLYDRSSCTREKRIILAEYCIDLWLTIYHDSLLLFEYYPEEYKNIITKLNKLVSIFRYVRTFRKLIHYVLIKIFGINNTLKIKLFYFKIKKNPKYINIKI
jgi:glycosyltransferase involved in cell wall biosynthesis